MRTANPALREDTFAPGRWGGIMADLERHESRARLASTTMTVRGTAVKTAVLIAICSVVAVFTYAAANSTLAGKIWPIGVGAFFGALVIGLVMCFKPKASPFLAPLYALAEGVVLGLISHMFAQQAGARGAEMVGQAVGITLSIALAMAALYSFGLIRISSTAMKVIIVATAGVMLLYLVQMISGMFGARVFPAIHEGGPIGITFSVVVIALASANLVLDFQMTDQGVAAGAPKYMEWYMGYAILVTLVWLYIEVLRLLAKLRRN